MDTTRRDQTQDDLEDFFENGAVALHWVGGDGTILRVNRAELELLGFTREDYLGHHIAEFHADPDVIGDILTRLSQGERLDKYPARLRARDGSIKHVLISSSVQFRDGRFVNTRCFTLDVTDLRAAEEQQRSLIAELNHRVKNTLAVVQSIATQSVSGDRTLEEAREAFTKRLRALARAHDLLTAGEWKGASLRAVLEGELRPYRGRAELAGTDLALTPKAALAFSLVLHELATNAAKYGAFLNADGRLEISWEWQRPSGGRPELYFQWRERDGPPVTVPSRRGFGRTLIEQGLKHDLDGTVAMDFRPDGLVCELTIPEEAGRAGL